MISYPFEDPLKTVLRDLCIDALDLAGYSILEEPQRIDFPTEVELEGAIVGDIQAQDSDGNLHIFYIRPSAIRGLPGWLQNIGLAGSYIRDVFVHVMAPEVSQELQKACKRARLGLVELADSGDLRIHVFPDKSVADRDQILEGKIQTARRELEAQREYFKSVNYSMASGILTFAADLSNAKREYYLGPVRDGFSDFETWSSDLAHRIDQCQSQGDEIEIDIILIAIKEGFRREE